MASTGFQMNLFNKKYEVFNITNILSKIDDHIKLLDGRTKISNYLSQNLSLFYYRLT